MVLALHLPAHQAPHWQQRKKPKFVSKTQETDDNVFMKKTFLYGVDSRGNAGFGFWQMAYAGDGTAEA